MTKTRYNPEQGTAVRVTARQTLGMGTGGPRTLAQLTASLEGDAEKGKGKTATGKRAASANADASRGGEPKRQRPQQASAQADAAQANTPGAASSSEGAPPRDQPAPRQQAHYGWSPDEWNQWYGQWSADEWDEWNRNRRRPPAEAPAKAGAGKGKGAPRDESVRGRGKGKASAKADASTGRGSGSASAAQRGVTRSPRRAAAAPTAAPSRASTAYPAGTGWRPTAPTRAVLPALWFPNVYPRESDDPASAQADANAEQRTERSDTQQE